MLKNIGKVGKEWLKTRKQWLHINQPNHQGYYECYICGRWVPASQITLDHVAPRSARPDLRNDFDNLRPACSKCNNEKGSRHD